MTKQKDDFCSNNYKLDEYKKESFNRFMKKALNRVITVNEFQKASCGGTDKYLKIAMDVFKSYEILILILLR